MNDISVKVVESPKEQISSEDVPIVESVAENEVDPLAIDVKDGNKIEESTEVVETETESQQVNDKVNCDENAKEIENETQKEAVDETAVIEATKAEEVSNEEILKNELRKEELLKEDELLKEEELLKDSPDDPIENKKETTDIETGETNFVEEEVKNNADSELQAVTATVEKTAVAEKEEEKKVLNNVPSEEKEAPIAVNIVTEPEKVSEHKIEEPSPVKEIPEVPEKPKSVEKVVVEPDVEMAEAVEKPAEKAPIVEEKPPITEPRIKVKSLAQAVNGDMQKGEQPIKRRPSEDIPLDTESPLKKLCQEVEKTFPHHDSMINDYIQTATKNNVDEIQRHTEQLLAEIQTLRELAQKKEHEWNNILHLKKVKEEILLRLLRRKQVLSFEKSVETNGSDRIDPFDYMHQVKNLAIDKSDEISGLAIKQPGSMSHSPGPMMHQPPVMTMTSHFNPMTGLPPPYDKVAHIPNMPKPVFPQPMMMAGPSMPGFPRDMNGQLPGNFGLPMGRQGPTKDVKSIIADYRQRNPDITPRRGRRMKSMLNPNMMNAPRPLAPKMDGLNNLNNINMLFNNLDMNQKAMLDRLQQIQAGGLPNGLSFKDVLVQFANMQQNATGLIPNRPPEPPTSRNERQERSEHTMANMRPEHNMSNIRPEPRRRPERQHERPERPQEDVHVSLKQAERLASPSPRLPPPPPYPEISLLPVTTAQDTTVTQAQQNSLLHGILTKQAPPASQSFSPTLAKLLTSPERKQSAPSLPTFGQAKNCGEITITPVQPTPPPEPQPQEKTEEVVQLDDEESPLQSEGEASGSPAGSGSGRLVIDEGSEETPLCQGCRRRDAQFVCAGCANQWYCSRECQVAAWDDHSEMCSG